MKVLFVTNLPSPYRVNFFSELSKHCELTVFFEGRRSKSLTFNWNDHLITSFKSVFFNDIFKEKYISLKLIKKVLFSNHDKLVISTYSTLTQSLLILLLKLLKYPYYFETDGGMIPSNEGRLKYFVKKTLISGAFGYFSTGTGADKYLMYYGAKPDKIVRYTFTSLYKKDIIDNVPTAEEKLRLKLSLGVPYNKIVIGVGQFIERKGFDILLKSAAHFSQDIGIYIIGGQPPQNYLDIQKQLGFNNVHYIDFLEKEILNQWFLASDIFVLPTREDVWGLVINEAMSKGLPVITTEKCLAGLELIKDKACICPVNDSAYLGQLISKISSNSEYLKDLAKQNLNTITNSTFENMALDHIREFRDNDKKNK